MRKYADIAFLALAVGVLILLTLTTNPEPVQDAPKACWTEPKTGTGYPPERICGYVRSAPDGSRDFSDKP